MGILAPTTGAIGSIVEVDPTSDDELAAIAGLTSAADRLPYFTGSGTAALATFTAAGRALVDDANAAAQLVTLGITASAAEVNLIDGSVAGTAVASKALSLGADKNVDVLAVADLKIGAGAGTSVTKTAAQINALVVGVAGGYMVARSAAPVALDGSNPTTVASGLTSIVACGACLAGTAAPGVGTFVLSTAISTTNINVYGWKPTSNVDCTLIASDGTETFHWWAIGT